MSLTSITCRTGEACAAIAEAGRPVAVPHVGALDPARVSHVVLGREVRPSSSYGTRLCLKKVQYGSVECRDQGKHLVLVVRTKVVVPGAGRISHQSSVVLVKGQV